MKNSSDSTFVIGAVARATGIPVETLRIWERRYEVVTPHRDSNKKRYFTAEDIERLKLIKQLVDLGHSIGSIARMDEGELLQRLELHSAESLEGGRGEQVRVMVCGEMLPELARGWAQADPGLNLAGLFQDPGDFQRTAVAERPTVLVMEMSFLTLDGLDRLLDLVERSGARRGAIVYGYGSRDLVERGRRMGLGMQRGPIDQRGFAWLCRLPVTAAQGMAADEVPPPRFNGEALARIATLSNSIHCECPQHLADLVFRIRAFERYSADCQNRNEQDAAVHARLRTCAGRARALFEDALAEVMAMEGMELGA